MCLRHEQCPAWGPGGPTLTSKACIPVSVGIHTDALGASVDGPCLAPHAVLGADWGETVTGMLIPPHWGTDDALLPSISRDGWKPPPPTCHPTQEGTSLPTQNPWPAMAAGAKRWDKFPPQCPCTHRAVGEGKAIGVGDNLEEDVHAVQDGGDRGVLAILLSDLHGEGCGSCLGAPRGYDQAAPQGDVKKGLE